MTATKTLFLLLLAVLYAPFPAAAQQKDTAKTIVKDTVIIEKIIEREVPKEEKSIDKSLDILNLAVGFFGLFFTALSIILAVIGGVFAFYGYRTYTDLKKNLAEAKKDAKVITAMREKLEKETDALSKEMEAKKINLSSIEKLSEENKQKLNDLSSKLEFLEEIGGKLNAVDYMNRGNDFYYKNRFDLVLKALDKAIELKPDYVDAWNNKGITLSKLERYEEALKSFDQAITLKPDYVTTWNNRGITLSKLERYEEALKAYDQSITLKPDDA